MSMHPSPRNPPCRLFHLMPPQQDILFNWCYLLMLFMVMSGRIVLSITPGTLSCLDFQSSSPYLDRTAATACSTTVFLLILCMSIITIIIIFIIIIIVAINNFPSCEWQCTGISVIILHDAIALWVVFWTNDREIGVPVPLATGSRIATMGQLLFAPWAWVYLTLHPFRVGK